ncbi:peptide ABC transporter permease [Chryseomicrobium excrementi]|uniref:Peptide ABC transporter permease n=1 Tax=Chryseomicrobium excrementi TaxID=2041346 RepID=A0A2M9F0F6_9BACL|nr:ABC transporter permease [Chryseomicrobium excrementi]PJK16943.1 peptide ABC transporter permease [Chryseomicrobium excrementi]
MTQPAVFQTISQSSKWKKTLVQARYAIFHDVSGFIGFVILALICILSVISPWVFPVDSASNAAAILQPPSTEHILGTDHLGRDIFAQIANGGRDLLVMALITATLGIFLGVILGAFSAIIGGKVDSLLLLLADVWLSIPRLPLLVVLSAFITLNSVTFAVLLAILSWAGLYRTIRAEVLSLKERPFIEAAFMQDLSLSHIVFKEIAPNLIGFIAINYTLLMKATIYAQVGLVFLGILPLEQNWGVMINQAWTQGVIYNPDSIVYILAPTLMICLLIVSLVWVGKSLEDVFHPSLRK